MPPSIVDKYEQIFAADPRSRIFVELAKALLERGEADRVLEVCRVGLEHHPSSILGRVIWGRALLERGDARGAEDQFEIAIALDPASPYAYNLIGQALFTKGLYREALPVLARAVELQPADARLRAWLEQARERALARPPSGPSAAAPDEDAPEITEPYRPLPPRPASAFAPGALPPSPVLALTPPTRRAPRPVGPADAGTAASPVLSPGTPRAGAPTAAPGAPPILSAAAPVTAPASAAQPAPGPAAPPRPPPLAAVQPALHHDVIPPSLLGMIPGATRPSLAAAPAALPAEPDEAEAEQITARFEQEVRERLLAEPEPRPSPLRRHPLLALAAVLVAACAGATLVYLRVQAVSAGDLATSAAARARVGLARDTVGALREAARVLAEARRASRSPELTSLTAQVAALLGTEHADPEARTLAADLAGRPDAGDGGLAARFLLAESPAERVSAEAAVLAAPPSSEPILQALAGRILVRRGELEAGRGRLEIGAHASPPLLRALSDLGDAALAGGDPEGALGLYGAALSLHATHPRSVVGAAEARLLLGRDLPRARTELAALEADPDSAPPPDLRVRYEIASARVLAATGDPAGAAARLAHAAERLGESAALASATAEVQLAAHAWERAETAAARAVALAPGDAAARVLLARAHIGRGRYAEALAATGTAEGRAIRLQRAIARYHLGQLAEARAELERTARDGKMPAEAAVWYALTEIKLGRAARAQEILEKLAAAHASPPLAAVALGRALEAQDKPTEAEAAYRQAVERDPSGPEGHAALGELLLARGAPGDAVPELEKAVAADPTDLELRRALAAGRLSTAQPALARADLAVVLTARPADLSALRLLSSAWLAEGQPTEARRAADRGLARAPRDPGLLIAAARAAHAQGERGAARALAVRATKAAGRGPSATEARALAAELHRR